MKKLLIFLTLLPLCGCHFTLVRIQTNKYPAGAGKPEIATKDFKIADVKKMVEMEPVNEDIPEWQRDLRW